MLLEESHRWVRHSNVIKGFIPGGGERCTKTNHNTRMEAARGKWSAATVFFNSGWEQLYRIQ